MVRARISRLRQLPMPTFRGGRSSKTPFCQDLIRTTLKQNYDLQTATERITYARASTYGYALKTSSRR